MKVLGQEETENHKDAYIIKFQVDGVKDFESVTAEEMDQKKKCLLGVHETVADITDIARRYGHLVAAEKKAVETYVTEIVVEDVNNIKIKDCLAESRSLNLSSYLQPSVCAN